MVQKAEIRAGSSGKVWSRMSDCRIIVRLVNGWNDVAIFVRAPYSLECLLR
jgi:hypothetical protein